MKRSSGILLPVSSLPSPYGIGTLGKASRDFIDFLADAGQSWWQILPVGPTSIGDSPYQSPSAFAGNPWFIDLDLLAEEGLLEREDPAGYFWGDEEDRVRYDLLYQNRPALLHRAMERGWNKKRDQIRLFAEENADWLEDYALFMALKRHFGMKSWQEWPDEDARLRRPQAMDRYRKLLREDIDYTIFTQYLFSRQWEDLHCYAREKGIRILGDMALYVALDSVDVWVSPEYFQLDGEGVPVKVAGVPPDAFSDDGQLWGNPLYNYEIMERDGYRWWLNRIRGAARLYDAIRIDHFRGLESYWAVPYGEKTTRSGKWVKGPGMELIRRIKEAFPDTQFFAEDLGYPTPEVQQLLQDSGFPGMKVLEFAFDSRDAGGTLPHAFPRNCVCYAGTHDNNTLRGWLDEAPRDDVSLAKRYLGLNEEEGLVRGMLRGGMSSVSDLFVAQIQDYLELGAESRMNVPGSLSGNWQWRLKSGQLTPELAGEIAEMTALYERSSPARTS